MIKYFILILTLAALPLFAAPEKTYNGIVKVDNKLNVRVKPGKQYYIVSTLKNGDKVKIYRKVDDWYEIAAPANSSVWVAGHLISQSRTRREVNLRSGPSREYQAYRTEPAGIAFEILDKKGHGGWFKIKPPVDLKAWVSARFIEVDAYDKEKLNNPVGQRKLVLVDTESGNFSGFLKKGEDEKVDFCLPFIKGTKKEVTLKGQIVPLKAGAVFVTHALVVKSKLGYKTLAFLHCRRASLNVWKNKFLVIQGTQQLVRGWKTPVVEVKTILPEYSNTKTK